MTIGTVDASNNSYVYRYVNNADLDVTSAQTPSLLSHKLFGGVAYWAKHWEMPILLGVGGHYEWVSCDLISNWGFNARVGLGF